MGIEGVEPDLGAVLERHATDFAPRLLNGRELAVLDLDPALFELAALLVGDVIAV